MRAPVHGAGAPRLLCLHSVKARGRRAEERAVEREEAVRRASHVLLPVLRRIVVGASGSIMQHENNSHAARQSSIGGTWSRRFEETLSRVKQLVLLRESVRVIQVESGPRYHLHHAVLSWRQQ